MKILHLPTNIASMPAITVKALNAAGHEAKGLILDSTITQSSEGMEVYNFNKESYSKYLVIIRWYLRFLRLVWWADIIHWCGSFSPLLEILTLPVIRILKKPAVVEFVGSDIRNPEIEFRDNPFYREVFDKGYEYPYESAENSQKTQLKFARAGFDVIAMPGMEQYIDKSIFPHPYRIFQRIEADRFEFRPPDPGNPRPLIVHAPTAPVGKGTKYIISTVEKLKKSFTFEFVLIKNMPHAKALELIQRSDIYIDQLISGSYGMAAMEAMAFGKPVMSFLKSSVLKNEFPVLPPVINVNPDNLLQELTVLLNNGEIRHEIGSESREFVLQYHDIKKVMPQLINCYKSILNKR